jgi:hypothetical protein
VQAGRATGSNPSAIHSIEGDQMTHDIEGIGPLGRLARLRNCTTRRESSWDRTGGNRDAIPVEPGKLATLADIKGAGCVRHIWFTISCKDPNYLRAIILRAYWDAERQPSIEVPVGDFFGIGHGIAHHFTSLPLTMTCDRGFNCYFPMPFAKRARFEVENQSEEQVRSFYYYIDYELYDDLPDDYGRFHAQWRRVNPMTKSEQGPHNLTGGDNYLILDAKGRGHYVGCSYHIHGLRPRWWGEGDDMIFVDGEKWPPSLHGTGTEDYFCAAWGFNREFYGPYHGFPLKGNDDWTGKHSAYRFHLEDPVCFRKSLRVTIEHGHANDRADDLATVAYWYQTEPHAKFPDLPPYSERLPQDWP